MNSIFVISVCLASVICIDLTGQDKSSIFKTKWVPHSVTYNGSDNPNECWESVDFGIKIETSNGDIFFTMPYREVERLKEIIKDAEVWVEVIYYPVLERADRGSGAGGYVAKITLNDEVIYKNL